MRDDELYDFFVLLRTTFEGYLLKHVRTMLVGDDANQLIGERLCDAHASEINFDWIVSSKLTLDLVTKQCSSRARSKEVLLRMLFQQEAKS